MSGPRSIGILLAAGRGRRFDPQGLRSKLLQTVAGREVAAHACLALAAGCEGVIAVVRPDSPEMLIQVLAQCGAQVLVCPDADLGMGHSLAAAARAVVAMHTPVDAVLVMPADMPWMRAESVIAVRDTWAAVAPEAWPDRIVQPALADGRRGHPVAFGRAHFPALCELRADEGARSLLRMHSVSTVALDDPGILQDIDVPSDLPAS